MSQEPAMVYVVDDDASVRRALQRLLRSVGLTSEGFDSAEAFLQRTSPAHDPACLILDVHLTGMSGPELCGLLEHRDPTLPIIFMSAHDDEQSQALACDSRVGGFLRKPLDTTALLGLVERALSGTTATV